MGWISVKDRLPKNNEKISFTYDGKNILNNIYLDRSNGNWEYENSLGYYVNVKEITHWMPLPEPPKDE